MLLVRSYLYYTICRHLICRLPLYIEAVLLNLLADLILVNINILKLSSKLILLLYNNSNSLLVVILDNRRLIKL